MQRISHEQMLIQYIQEHEIDLAKSTIERLQRSNNLDSLDDNGKSFLHHAIEADEEELAKNLFELLKNIVYSFNMVRI